MADITSGGRPAAERNESIYQRRIELQVMRHRASVLEAELEIEQKQDEIVRLRERIDGALKQIETAEAELATRRQGGQNNG